MKKTSRECKTTKRDGGADVTESVYGDSPRYEYEGRNFDRMFHAFLSRFVGWLSPTALVLAYVDWLAYLCVSPAKRLDLANDALKRLIRHALYMKAFCSSQDCEPCVTPRLSDQRFKNEMWQQPPFNFYSQIFLSSEQWWEKATTNIRGVSRHHQNLANFVTRQVHDMFSPSNFPWMNPEVISASMNEAGMNFVTGFNNYIEDVSRHFNNQPPVGAEKYKVGVNVAVTKGKVIYRNHLVELVQYSPTTARVYGDPVLIVPAWIMKYYILDLSPDNSMVKFLVDKGHTVFMISWRNPTSEDRSLSLADYVRHGIMDAIKAINHIVPGKKIHATGYCIGGTLLMIAAARMAARSEDYLKSITIFAAQVDFKDAGELLLFIDENQITYLEDIMWEKGYLNGAQMADTFSMLRSIDLIWSRMVRDYLLGQRQPVSDLMAWDYDTTRLPYKMHSEYLRSLFLNNDLVEGRFMIGGEAIALYDITVPVFAVSTTRDHVSPWKSVYKLHYLIDSDITFVLANAGHNTGIINKPGLPHRSYQMQIHQKNDKLLSAAMWQLRAPRYKGSWWPAWEKWLTIQAGERSEKIAPPPVGNPDKGLFVLCDAPGTYVHQK